MFRTWTAFLALCVTRFLWGPPRLFATWASPQELTHGSSSLEGPPVREVHPRPKPLLWSSILEVTPVSSATFCSLEVTTGCSPHSAPAPAPGSGVAGVSGHLHRPGHSLPLRVAPLQLRCHVLRPLPDELPTMPHGETPRLCPRTGRGGQRVLGACRNAGPATAGRRPWGLAARCGPGAQPAGGAESARRGRGPRPGSHARVEAMLSPLLLFLKCYNLLEASFLLLE